MDKDLDKRLLRDAMERHGYDEFEARLYLLGALAINTDAVRQVLRDAMARAAELKEAELRKARRYDIVDLETAVKKAVEIEREECALEVDAWHAQNPEQPALSYAAQSLRARGGK